MRIKASKCTGIVISLLLHALLVLLFVPDKQSTAYIPPVTGEDEPKRVEVKLIPAKPDINEIPTIPESPITVPKYESDPTICGNKDNSYIGVGILIQPGTNLVTHAPQSFPAYKAGVRVGDMILDPDSPIKDGFIDFNVRRGYAFLHFHIRADKICYRES